MSGLETTVLLPLYREARARAQRLEPIGAPFAIPLGRGVHTARLWRQRDSKGPEIIFIEQADFFDRPNIYGDDGDDYPDNAARFAFFTLAAVAKLPDLVAPPVVLHAHDWHTALAPLLARRRDEPFYRQVATVLTVHNTAYQGIFSLGETAELTGSTRVDHVRDLEWGGNANWLKAGLLAADASTTVSPTHAREVRETKGGFGLHAVFGHLGDRFVGIRNGVEGGTWNPATDPHIPVPYSPDDLSGKSSCKRALQAAYGLALEPRTPLVLMCARLVEQKGVDLVLRAVPRLRERAQFVIIGRGERRYEELLRRLAQESPDRVAVPVAFDEIMERRALAGADILLMPSLYEPCGLTQMRAQLYGTPPVARRVGGLADSVRDGATGFLFDSYDARAMEHGLCRAFDAYDDPAVWWAVVQRAIREKFDWSCSLGQYRRLYHRAHGRLSRDPALRERR